ncbi:hypothetical protein SAMN05519105_2236 [Rhodobacter sp. 24-YEA-8]|nr:hypothetical protein SAMN05519105_2236 [Rhodobacter sp. 24-YEA-8]
MASRAPGQHQRDVLRRRQTGKQPNVCKGKADAKGRTAARTGERDMDRRPRLGGQRMDEAPGPLARHCVVTPRSKAGSGRAPPGASGARVSAQPEVAGGAILSIHPLTRQTRQLSRKAATVPCLAGPVFPMTGIGGSQSGLFRLLRTRWLSCSLPFPLAGVTWANGPWVRRALPPRPRGWRLRQRR